MSSFRHRTESRMFNYILLVRFQSALFLNHPAHFMQALHRLSLSSGSLFNHLTSRSVKHKTNSMK